MRSHDISRWSFLLADERGAWAKGHDDTAWRAVVVPHDWSVEGDFTRDASSGTGYLLGGIAWYRAHISLSGLGPLEGRHVRIAFAGVYKNADVWVNGYHLGRRPSGFAHTSYDLTEIVSYAPDDDLVVAVRVEHTDPSDSRWFNGAGITRRVALVVHEPVRVPEHGTVVTTVAADPAEATVRVQQTVRNDLGHAVAVAVHHELRSLTSDAVHDVTTHLELPADGTVDVDVDVEIVVADPLLWSDDDPHLYALTTTLSWPGEDGSRSTRYRDVVGIRTIAFDADHGFSVNGHRRVLRGVCLHEDAGCLGTAVPASVWLRRLLTLQEMGANAVRMAHNPHAPEIYALCDALGLYVIDEAFDEWENPKNKWWQGHNVYPPRHEGYAHDFPQWHERDLVAMVDAHRNHPSVIAWSIGNEIDYPNDPYASPLFEEMTGNNDANKPASERVYDPNRPDMRRLTTIAHRLSEIVREHDSTRPTTLAAAFPELSSRLGLVETVDVIGYNYKEHLYTEDHARFPGIPLLGSENGHGHEQWRAVVDNEFVAGQFLWTGIDYLGEAHGWPVRGSGAGVMTLAGFPKHTWHLRRSWWSTEPTAYLVTRPQPGADEQTQLWTHPVSRDWERGSGVVQVLCFAGADGAEPTLTCGDDEIALVRDEHLGCWTASLAPRDEPLVLTVVRDGEVVARDELAARGGPARLDAALWRAPAQSARRIAGVGLAADDVLQLECTLLDEHGRPARGDVGVSVEVEGGELLGIEGGDLADTTPYRSSSRATSCGRLIVFVRPAGGPSTVHLRADGLAPVAVTADAPERIEDGRDHAHRA